MTTTTPGVRTIYRNPSRAARAKPEGPGRELAWWWFMRISGLILVLMVLGHMFIMHVLVELNDGAEINFAFVSSRWGNLFWRLYDLVLLVLALIHGANGARIIIADYVVNRTARGLLVVALWVLALVWLVLGIMVIAFFDPDSAPPVGPFS